MQLPLVVPLLALLPFPGESIYRSGTAAGGDITATFAAGEVRVAAAVVPCASCHGADGRGGNEGGVVSPDIRWQTLSKPYAVTTAGGRRRAPYTKRLLTRAITMGIDSAGNPLNPVMPRYRMTGEQMDALQGFLRNLDGMKIPGVSDEAIRVGVVLPPQEPLPGLTEAFRSSVSTFFGGIAGGVYGRRVDPVFIESRGTAGERAEAVRKFVRENDVLALAPAFTDGAEEELAKMADEEQVPLLASMTARPASSGGSYTWLRDLYAGTAEQARLLARYAVQHLGIRDAIAVVAGADSRAAEEAIAELKELGVSARRSASWPDAAAAVIFLGDDALLQRRSAGVKAIFAPAVLATPALLDETSSTMRVFIALPTTLRDLTPEGMAVWRIVSAPSVQYRGSQLAALATSRLFVHALERAGREVTRQSLLRAVDGVHRLDTGFSPPLTFGANRHIGSIGAWIVEATAPDPEPVWVEP